MNIELRFGPRDGKKLKLIDINRTIVVEFKGRDYLYKKTERVTVEGLTIYQFVMVLNNGCPVK